MNVSLIYFCKKAVKRSKEMRLPHRLTAVFSFFSFLNAFQIPCGVNPSRSRMINSKVIDGPGGVPSWYEDVSPMNTLKREIIMGAANTHLNPLAIRIAKAAGSTRSAETSKDADNRNNDRNRQPRHDAE